MTWLRGRAPKEDSPAPEISIPSALQERERPSDNVSEEVETLEPDENGKIELDEVFCVIDYTDAQGFASRRRITTRSIAKKTTGPVLTAVCHERRAVRHFRADRIECFITDDGEVIEPLNFFREFLSVDLNRLNPTEEDNEIIQAREIRDFLRAPLSILILCARSDDEFHPEEMDAIALYAEQEVFHLNNEIGRFDNVSIGTLNQLNKMISTMRPQESSIQGYANRICGFNYERGERFSKALEKLVMADGKVSIDEQDFLNDFAAAEEHYLENIFGDWET